MAAFDVVLSRAGLHTLIPVKDFHEFDPVQYVYRRLSFSCRKLSFEYEVIDKPTKKGEHNDFGDILTFCRRILEDKHTPKGGDREERKALDVKISRHSYIVFELPAGWEFSPASERPGVTLGGEHPDTDSYGNLMYVTQTEHSPDPIENCRLVYFSAINNHGTEAIPYLQPINFNIVTSDGVAVVVDPDIRFPGNGSP